MEQVCECGAPATHQIVLPPGRMTGGAVVPLCEPHYKRFGDALGNGPKKRQSLLDLQKRIARVETRGDLDPTDLEKFQIAQASMKAVDELLEMKRDLES